MPVQPRMRSRYPAVIDPEIGLRAAPQHHRHVLAVERLVDVQPDQPHRLRLQRVRYAAKLGGRHVNAAAPAHHMHLHRLGPATQVHPVERAEARPQLVGQAGQHLAGDQGLVVAGMVDQPGGHVDGVAKAVAAHFNHLATGQRHLQAQAAQAGRCAPLAAPDDQQLQLFVHFLRGQKAFGRCVEHRHQTITQCLDQVAAAGRHGARQGGDGVRHDRRGLGIAQGLVEGCAAPKVSKQHGALSDARHAGQFNREFVPVRQACPLRVAAVCCGLHRMHQRPDRQRRPTARRASGPVGPCAQARSLAAGQRHCTVSQARRPVR